MIYRYRGSNKRKRILNWSNIKNRNLLEWIFLGYAIFLGVFFSINKVGMIPMIVMMIKIIGFTSLITKYDEKNEARYTKMREIPTFSFLFRNVIP